MLADWKELRKADRRDLPVDRKSWRCRANSKRKRRHSAGRPRADPGIAKGPEILQSPRGSDHGESRGGGSLGSEDSARFWTTSASGMTTAPRCLAIATTFARSSISSSLGARHPPTPSQKRANHPKHSSAFCFLPLCDWEPTWTHIQSAWHNKLRSPTQIVLECRCSLRCQAGLFDECTAVQHQDSGISGSCAALRCESSKIRSPARRSRPLVACRLDSTERAGNIRVIKDLRPKVSMWKSMAAWTSSSACSYVSPCPTTMPFNPRGYATYPSTCLSTMILSRRSISHSPVQVGRYPHDCLEERTRQQPDDAMLRPWNDRPYVEPEDAATGLAVDRRFRPFSRVPIGV